MICPRCHSSAPDESRFCPSCGTRIVSSAESTFASSDPASPARRSPSGWLNTSGAIDHGRFTPGAVIDTRYRIVGLLGRGGMGEVYRADDLRLGQPVALKFLAEEFSRDGLRVAQLHHELRMARQVTHANVCRVYDIGEADGHVFISMEYVDGEDLAASLKRIGRFPEDRAVALAGQLCAGLAAAHERGVIHRDLKPANIMIDGDGRVRIMDFGIATAGAAGHDARLGTPEYMSPEQIAGNALTTRSDIYSLGLVLYELFTGRRAFTAATMADLALQQAVGEITAPTEVVKSLDPAIERVVLRCLQSDAKKRPSSALAIAAALPGGDPLAAAVAAGETPSPDMVAAAGSETATLTPRAGLLWMALGIAGLVAVAALSDQALLVARAPFDKTPDVLLDRARTLEASFGYGTTRFDRAWSFERSSDAISWLWENNPAGAMRALGTGMPPTIRFWYRSSPRSLAPLDGTSSQPLLTDPPATVAGMVTIVLDSMGRLLEFRAVPPAQIAATADGERSVSWPPFFDAAGLEMSRFRPASAESTPAAFADRRAAWTGAFADAADIPIRVDAASVDGRATEFVVTGPWVRAPGAEARAFASPIVSSVIALVTLFIIAAGAWLARRNLTRGRGDRRGAARLAAFVGGGSLVAWAFSAHYVADLQALLFSFQSAVAAALYRAGSTWLLFLALEPEIRRVWPHALVTWTRVTSGSFHDPMVGRDLLIGTCLGILALVTLLSYWQLVAILGRPMPPATDFLGLWPRAATRFAVGTVFDALSGAAQAGVLTAMLLTLFLRLFRRKWLAFLGAMAILVVFPANALPGDSPALALLIGVCVIAILLGVLLRFGLAALVATFAPYFTMMTIVPLTLVPSRQYFSLGLTFALIFVAIMALGFKLARANEPSLGFTGL